MELERSGAWFVSDDKRPKRVMVANVLKIHIIPVSFDILILEFNKRWRRYVIHTKKTEIFKKNITPLS